MSDRIVVMNHGNIQQIGSAEDIYQRPNNAFVAEFIGQQTFFEATVQHAVAGNLELETGAGPMRSAHDEEFSAGESVRVAIRPEDIRIQSGRPADQAPTAANQVTGSVTSRSFLGDVLQYLVQIEDGTEVLVRTPAAIAVDDHEGDQVSLEWDSSAVRVFPHG